jgi:hypothetical protein
MQAWHGCGTPRTCKCGAMDRVADCAKHLSQKYAPLLRCHRTRLTMGPRLHGSGVRHAAALVVGFGSWPPRDLLNFDTVPVVADSNRRAGASGPDRRVFWGDSGLEHRRGGMAATTGMLTCRRLAFAPAAALRPIRCSAPRPAVLQSQFLRPACSLHSLCSSFGGGPCSITSAPQQCYSAPTVL